MITPVFIQLCCVKAWNLSETPLSVNYWNQLHKSSLLFLLQIPVFLSESTPRFFTGIPRNTSNVWSRFCKQSCQDQSCPSWWEWKGNKSGMFDEVAKVKIKLMYKQKNLYRHVTFKLICNRQPVKRKASQSLSIFTLTWWAEICETSQTLLKRVFAS